MNPRYTLTDTTYGVARRRPVGAAPGDEGHVTITGSNGPGRTSWRITVWRHKGHGAVSCWEHYRDTGRACHTQHTRVWTEHHAVA